MSTATVATSAASVPVVSAYPDPIELPVAPKGDPTVVRLLADAYRGQADRLDQCGRQLLAICTDLGERWHGTGSTALTTPLSVIGGNLHQLTTGYRHTADALDRYADALHHAQHHHGWSLGRIVAVGAIITVTAVAVVVTVGAAAPVGTVAALEVGEAIAGAEAAVATATAAETTAITALNSTGLNVSLTALRAVALRQLAAGAINTTFDLGQHGMTGRPITGPEVVLDVVTGTAAGATVDATRAALHATEAWQALNGLGRAALDTTALAGTLTADDALRQYETTGHLNPTRLTEAAVVTSLTGGLNVLRVARRSGIAPGTPSSAASGQTLADIVRNGVKLEEHEGPDPLGHVLDKHVGMTIAQLKHRLQRTQVSAASTFPDQATAERAITDALRLSPGEVAKVLMRQGSAAYFPVDVGWTVGTVVRRDNTVVPSQIVMLKIVNIGGRIVIRTAFAANP